MPAHTARESHGIRRELLETAEAVPVDALRFYPGNARIHDDDVLEESLRTHGQYKAITVNRRTSEVLAGNGTYHSCMALGWTHVAVSWVDVDDEQARKIVTIDNATSDRARNDESALAELLQSMDTLDGSGYGNDELTKMLAGLDKPLTFGDAPTDTDYAEAYGVVVECSDERQQAQLLSRLSAEGLTVRAVM